MAAQVPKPGPASPPIEAKFICNEGETWYPGDVHAKEEEEDEEEEYDIVIGGPPFTSEEPRRFSTTPRKLHENFIEFLEGKLAAIPLTSNRRLFYCSALHVARDTTTKIYNLSLRAHNGPIESLQNHFNEVEFTLRGKFEAVCDAYDKNPRMGNSLDNDEGQTKETKGRSGADKKAQHEVPQWYGKACILCGFSHPQGAHIVPVRTIKNLGLETLWYSLRIFWPLPTISQGELDTNGREATNILPLCPNAHWLWDCYDFALRPIEDQDPEKRRKFMYLQMLWLKPQGTTAITDTLSDFRRVRAGPHPGIKHGDIYQLTTTDPTTRPLPNFRLLEIQLGAHKILAGIRAAAAAGDIFQGNPPDDDGPAIPSDRHLPTKWQVALDAAVEYGALDDATAERWRTVLLRDVNRVHRQFSGEEEEEEETKDVV